MLIETSQQPNATSIIQSNNVLVGFINVRTHKDGISGESCGTIPLPSVSFKSQGSDVGKMLMKHTEYWAKEIECQLLYLEYFSNNTNVKKIYQNVGF